MKEDLSDSSPMVEDNSVVEEVAATVSVVDDPSLPALTVRMFLIGTVVCALLGFINQYFFFRTASIYIGSISAVIVTLYVGRFMALYLPNWSFSCKFP